MQPALCTNPTERRRIDTRKSQYVICVGNQWGVRAESSKRLTGVFATQGEAIAAGRDIAENQRSDLHIQGRNARFQDARSYGNDPLPPRG